MPSTSSRPARPLAFFFPAVLAGLVACGAFGTDEPAAEPGGADAGNGSDSGGPGGPGAEGGAGDGGGTASDASQQEDADDTRDADRDAAPVLCSSGLCDPFSGVRCASLRGGIWDSEKGAGSTAGVIALEVTGRDCPLRARVPGGVNQDVSDTAHSLAYSGTLPQKEAILGFDVTVSELPEVGGAIELMRLGSDVSDTEPFVGYLTALRDGTGAWLQLSVQPGDGGADTEVVVHKMAVTAGQRVRGALRLALGDKKVSGAFGNDKGPEHVVAFLEPATLDLWAGLYFNYRSRTGSFLFHQITLPR